MADSIEDIQLTGTDWQNAYTATGFTVGDAIKIQNKNTGIVFIWIGETKPSASSKNGECLLSGQQGIVTAGASGVWLLGSGPVSVQQG